MNEYKYRIQEVLKQNLTKTNERLSLALLVFLFVDIVAVIGDAVGLLQFSDGSLLRICLIFAFFSVGPYFLCHYTDNDQLNRKIVLSAWEICLCLLANNGIFQLDILYLVVPTVCIMYLDKKLLMACFRNCLAVMCLIKGLQLVLFVGGVYENKVWSSQGGYTGYEQFLGSILGYICFCALLYIGFQRLDELFRSGYLLFETEKVQNTIIAEKVEENDETAYNTKGLFLEIEQSVQTVIKGRSKQFLLDVDTELPVQLVGEVGKIKTAFVAMLTDLLQFTQTGSVFLQVSYDKGIIPKKGYSVSLLCRINCTEDISEPIKSGEAMSFAMGKGLIHNMNGVVLDKTAEDEYGQQRSSFTVSLMQKVEDAETLRHAKYVHQSEQKTLISESRKKVQDILLAREVKVLIVDDSMENLRLVDSILKSYGMITECVSNAEVALEKIKTKAYDLCIIDHMMPIKGGIQTAREIRQMGEKDSYFEMVPLLAMTTSVTEESLDVLKNSGFSATIPKPIKESELRQIISKFMFL